MWFARVRSFIARHRAVYWAAVAGVALTIAAVLLSQSRQLTQARNSWGASTSVWVATVDASPGDALVAERRLVPAAMVPDDAITGAWHVATARQSVTSGEIVVAHDVGTGRLPLLPSGWRAVAVPADEGTITVAVGDRVDIVAAGVVVADDCVVVELDPGAVIVGMPAPAAPLVAAAASDRTVVVVMRGG